jgi:hypothetical protein
MSNVETVWRQPSPFHKAPDPSEIFHFIEDAIQSVCYDSCLVQTVDTAWHGRFQPPRPLTVASNSDADVTRVVRAQRLCENRYEASSIPSDMTLSSEDANDVDDSRPDSRLADLDTAWWRTLSVAPATRSLQWLHHHYRRHQDRCMRRSSSADTQAV